MQGKNAWTVRVPGTVADELAVQYDEILVDEYQDTNLVQETLIQCISGERFDRPNVFMGGDGKQSIYKFRLARPELFLEKYSTKEASLTKCFETAQYRHSQVLRLSHETLAPIKVLLQKLEANTSCKNNDFASPLLAKILCLEFLIELNRITLSPKAGFLTESTLDYRISSLLAYINSHLDEPMDMASLSALSGLSSYHMMRLFKQETGYTVGNYITEKRLIKARDLLSQGTCATQACYLSGFQNYSTFLRAYKKRYPGRPKDILNSI